MTTRRVQVLRATEQHHLVAHLEFFIRAGIYDVSSRTFDGHNARAGPGSQSQFADEFAIRG
jgi:hypothetical protein